MVRKQLEDGKVLTAIREVDMLPRPNSVVSAGPTSFRLDRVPAVPC